VFQQEVIPKPKKREKRHLHGHHAERFLTQKQKKSRVYLIPGDKKKDEKKPDKPK